MFRSMLLRRSKAFAVIQLIANLAIIVIAVLLGALYVQQQEAYRRLSDFRSSVPSAERPKTPKGNIVRISGVDWSINGRTLVLALKSGCRFCTESAPFYKELLKKQAKSPVHLVAVFPENDPAAQSYLDTLGISINIVRQVPLDELFISGTPTILLVDSNGQVTDAWIGRLDPRREQEVLSEL